MGACIAQVFDVEYLEVIRELQLVINLTNRTYRCQNAHLKSYQDHATTILR